jgi:hypothetical protein
MLTSIIVRGARGRTRHTGMGLNRFLDRAYIFLLVLLFVVIVAD